MTTEEQLVLIEERLRRIEEVLFTTKKVRNVRVERRFSNNTERANQTLREQREIRDNALRDTMHELGTIAETGETAEIRDEARVKYNRLVIQWQRMLKAREYQREYYARKNKLPDIL